jgi:hypothetical protein
MPFILVKHLLAATAFNLKKWMRIYFFALFLRDVLLLNIALKEINKIEQIQKKLFLISWKISLN